MTRLAVFMLILLVALTITLLVLWTSGKRPGGKRPSNAVVGGLAAAILMLAAGSFYLIGQSVSERDREGGKLSSPEGTSSADPAAQAARGAPEAAGPHIPPAFQGTWAPDRLACDTGGETARIEIGADTVDFYESAGRLEQAAPLSGGREYALTLSMTGEGQSWSRTIILRRVGHELALRDEGQGEERLYIRC